MVDGRPKRQLHLPKLEFPPFEGGLCKGYVTFSSQTEVYSIPEIKLLVSADVLAKILTRTVKRIDDWLIAMELD